MIVDSSDHDPGEKARLQLPTMKENDTHCIDFSYLLYSQKGLNPGTLNILVRVNKGPLANPIWNVTGFTGRDWLRAELAVSTFWPNEYQVIICSFLIHASMSLDLTVCVILRGKYLPHRNERLSFSSPPLLFLRKCLHTLTQNPQSRENILHVEKCSLGTKFLGCLAKSFVLTVIFLCLCSEIQSF